MDGQLNLSDWMPDACPSRYVGIGEYMNLPEPMCYSCKHALNRGNFRECAAGGTGYKHIGMIVDCDIYESEEEEDGRKENH